MNLIGEADALAGQWYGSFDDYYVMRWGQEAENAEAGSRYWGVLVNNVFTSVGGCQYELSAGDEVLWIYNAFDPGRFPVCSPRVSTTAPAPGH